MRIQAFHRMAESCGDVEKDPWVKNLPLQLLTSRTLEFVKICLRGVEGLQDYIEASLMNFY